MCCLSLGISEDHFLCSICLEVLTDPVTTPCGHNFCKTCISTHWNTRTTSRCPICNQVFRTKPQLKVNIMMREIVSQFRRESEQKAAAPREVPCDVCTGTKVKMIQKRREKLKEIRESVRFRKEAADRGKAEGVEVFTALMELVQRSLKELMETMEAQQEAEKTEAEGLIKELEEEIFELMKRSSEVMVHPSSYEGTVLRAVTQLEDTLSDEMIKMKLMLEMKKLQQFAVNVTLDPLTAQSHLVLSDDGKQVYDSDVSKNLPDNKERFSPCVCVLGKQSFSSGRFYFEVQVKGKTDWNFGVVKESINRKGYITATPKNGYWTVILRDGNVYKACEDHPVILHLKCVPEKIGVFVDYEEGVVSFYDVDAAALIYSFTHCCFTHKLHPFFNPSLNYGGKNSAPLIICPVNQSE
uniref:E3 ubiquitin-protein ligase TRIM21-like n=1 Tax=Gouania willdenowi TaxID=441366 RepID=A0A8C5GT21_GOUWI